MNKGGAEFRLLGVDPGLTRTGWGVISCRRDRVVMIDCGVIATAAATEFHDRLAKIYRELNQIIISHAPQVMAVENIIYAENVKIALSLGHASGSILLVAAHNDLPVTRYAPKEIKRAITGNGNASKEQVQRMVQAILGLKEIPKPNDKADALAVGLCHVHRMR